MIVAIGTALGLIAFWICYAQLNIGYDFKKSRKPNNAPAKWGNNPQNRNPLRGFIHLTLLGLFFGLFYVVPILLPLYRGDSQNKYVELLMFPYQAVFVGDPQKPVLILASASIFDQQGLIAFDVQSKEFKPLAINIKDSTISIEKINQNGVCLSAPWSKCLSPLGDSITGDFHSYSTMAPIRSFDLPTTMIKELAGPYASLREFELLKANYVFDPQTNQKIRNEAGELVIVEYKYMRFDGTQKKTQNPTYKQTLCGFLGLVNSDGRLVWKNEFAASGFAGIYDKEVYYPSPIYLAACWDSLQNQIWLYSRNNRIYRLDLQTGRRKYIVTVGPKKFTLF